MASGWSWERAFVGVVLLLCDVCGAANNGWPEEDLVVRLPGQPRLVSGSLVGTSMWMKRLGGVCFTTLLKLKRILRTSPSLSG
ncbi:hypothetical protein CK203_031185 [Vitis vinifera]|uniref:Secreted protein n=1 Tax=Vitis vinifera TaxID=29760 RepID=A0A438J0I1_VITVI|nr:hypothetical protein CK203_031185 [Vitis vinifera]